MHLLGDDDDIFKRRVNFIEGVNNVLCYFRNLDSKIKYKLFSSYCTNFYECRLGAHSRHDKTIEDVYVT